MRPLRDPAEIVFRANPAAGRESIVVTFEVLTPVFGGGMGATEDSPQLKEIDAFTPLRPLTIRGQLRAWWRLDALARGAQPEEVRRREMETWGSTDRWSGFNCDLDTSRITGLEPVEVFVSRQSGSGLWSPWPLTGMEGVAYAAFPLAHKTRQQEETRNGVLQRVQGAATMRLIVPSSVAPEVRRAIALWLSLGGVGGRTRRGFGAVAIAAEGETDTAVRGLTLAVREPDPAADESSIVIAQDGPRVEGPLGRHLIRKVAVRPNEFGTPFDALRDALGRLRHFRQGVGFARAGNQRVPGPSLWPESKVLQSLDRSRRKDARIGPLPRAAFGMPIIFQFIKGPPPFTLLPERGKRLASPLVLRPLHCGSRYRAAAFYLSTGLAPGEPGVVIGKSAHSAGTPAKLHLTLEAAAAIEPLAKVTPVSADAIEAFLAFFPR
jgi:CRISPR-associated protein Cmr1